MVDSIRNNKGPGAIEPLKPATKPAVKGKAKEGEDFAAALRQADQGAAAATPVKTSARPLEAAGVSFSPALHGVTKAAGEVEMERADKLAALKQQIADGNYQPDLKKVAASLLYFVAQGK